MRCKPTDLCIVVQDDDHEDEGKFVTVLRWVEGLEYFYPDGCANDRPGWLVHIPSGTNVYLADEPSAPPLHVTHSIFLDEQLRPIRDPGEDAVDEMLQPREVTA